MRLLAAVAVKEMLHIVRDRRTLALILLLPTALTFIFGYAFQTGSIENVPTAVLNLDAPSTLALQLVRAIEDDGTFAVVAWDRTEEEAIAALDRGEVKAVIVIPAGLKDAARAGQGEVRVTIDGIDTTSAPSVEGKLHKILLEYGLRMAGLKFRDLGFDKESARKVLEPIKLESRVLYNPAADFLTYVMPGIIGLILQLLTVILTANAITREKERGTFTQLVSTPVSRTAVLLGKLVPYVVISWINVTTILLVARYHFGIVFEGSLGRVLFLCGLFIASSLATGLLISALCRNQTQAMQIAVFYCMPAVMLSGAYAPLDILPASIKVISYSFPLTYFCMAFRDVYLKHHGLAQVSLEIGVMSAFVLFMLMFAGSLVKKQEV